MTDEKLFYKLSKETPESFKPYSIVSCKVEKVKGNRIFAKIQDNGLKGIINIYDTDYYSHENKQNKDN